MVIAGWAHFVRDWSGLQIIVGLHSIPLLFHWWYGIILFDVWVGPRSSSVDFQIYERERAHKRRV